jgi:hypothetical protein
MIMIKKPIYERAIFVVEIALVGLIAWIVLSSSLAARPGSIVQASNPEADKLAKQKSQERTVPPEGVEEAGSAQVLAAIGTPNACTGFDFEGGATQGFTVVNVSGASLWHVTNGLCRAFLTGHSTPYDFYYGQDGTCNYNTGARNASNLISPTINVTGTFAPFAVSFNYLLFVESSSSFDTTFVDISTNGGSTWTQILSKANLINDNQWHNVSVDVTAQVAAAPTVKLRFRFDSVDNLVNSSTGWHVDDILFCGQAFNNCVQDNNTGDYVQFNSVTGHYITKQCSTGFTAEGTGVVTTSGSTTTLKENGPIRFVTVSVNNTTHVGSASVKVKNGLSVVAYNISDSDTTNNTCICP